MDILSCADGGGGEGEAGGGDGDDGWKNCVAAGGEAARRAFVGWRARAAGVAYEQLWGDSARFDLAGRFGPAGGPEAWFVDGAHDYAHARADAASAARAGARLVVFHDADQAAVLSGARDGLAEAAAASGGPEYALRRVLDTRILYAVREE
jgi:hypothetical protein